ncbi:hypothetical protein L2E82_47649 [Cichorium intybus]|uniref:Uncharacterized protein n=1 Tax=Cichorium intybus TaxID=13427 RepID=A0ACB8YVA1_CICIN|nr:hypothetical protein L2E82_47649 [Cichorium intybus]
MHSKRTTITVAAMAVTQEDASLATDLLPAKPAIKTINLNAFLDNKVLWCEIVGMSVVSLSIHIDFYMFCDFLRISVLIPKLIISCLFLKFHSLQIDGLRVIKGKLLLPICVCLIYWLGIRKTLDRSFAFSLSDNNSGIS